MADASVRVAITASDESSAAISQVQAKLAAFKAQSAGAGDAMNYSIREARGSVMLLGEEVGVKMNRHLAGLLARSEILGPALASAFSLVAAIAFVDVLKRAYESIINVTNAIGGYTEAMKKQDQATIAANEHALTHFKTIIQGHLMIAQTNAQLEALNTTSGPLTFWQKMAGGVAITTIETKKQNETTDKTINLQKILREQLEQLTKLQIDANKENAKGIKDAANALEKYVDSVDKAYLKWFEVIHKAREGMGIFDYAKPGNPLISSAYPGGVTLPGQEAGFDTSNIAMLEINASKVDEVTKRLAQMQKQINYDRAAWSSFGQAMGDALSQGVLFGRSWSNILESIGVDIAKLILKMTIMKNLAASMSAGGATGFMSNMLMGLFGGGMAGGGYVSMGSAYLVGEKGPELFVPKTSGTIVPNGGASVQVNVINQSSQPVDARASKPTFDGRQFVTNVILQDLNSNGPLRQALATR